MIRCPSVNGRIRRRTENTTVCPLGKMAVGLAAEDTKDQGGKYCHSSAGTGLHAHRKKSRNDDV